MAKNSADKRKRRAKRKGKRTGTRGGGSNVIPLFGAASSIYDDFRDWALIEVYPGEPEPADGIAQHARQAMEVIGNIRPLFRPTAWTTDDADAIGDLLHSLRTESQLPEDVVTAMAFAVESFRGFLTSTGRWEGTPEAAEHAARVLAAAVGLQLQTMQIGAVDEPTERAALLATQPVRQLITLLNWLGEQRPTTQSRWLKPADARDLAELLGMELPENFTSMSTYPPLRHLWEYAQAQRVVEANTARAYPGVAAPVWTSGHTPVEIHRYALTHWISSGFPEALGADDEFHSAVVSVIVSGMTDSPNTIAEVRAWEPKLGLSDHMIAAILRRLDTFIDEGWLLLDDDKYVVPEALRLAVASAIPQPSTLDESLPRTLNQILTLRIQLEWVTPPVWRTVDVDASVTLDELHHILQVIFDWEESHLHSFDVRGERYMPEQALVLGDFDTAEPEEDYALGDLLGEVGDEMIYEYDFGDGWRHIITVQAVAPVGPSDDPPAAVVVDGAGLAPFENVGGPPGWEHFLEAVNNPKHPEHKTLRRWAGLGPNTPVDPAAFDQAAVNRQLRRTVL